MLRYLDCLMRAHFLAAETADALFIIVDRRISAAVIKADSFPFHRAALDADAAFFTFFFYDTGAALEDPEDDEAAENDGPVQYEVTCPACGATSVVDEEALLDGDPVCPSCGKPLDFEVTEE